MPLPSLPDSPITQQPAAFARIAAGMLGLVLLLAGSRVYRVAVVVPGILGGLAAGFLGARALGLPDVPTFVAAAVLAIVGGVVCHFVERIAVFAAGVIAGAGIGASVGPLLPIDPNLSWAPPVVGAVVGALAAWPLFDRALVLVTSVLGAVAVAFAAGWLDRPLVVAGLAVFGTVAQLIGGRKTEEE